MTIYYVLMVYSLLMCLVQYYPRSIHILGPYRLYKQGIITEKDIYLFLVFSFMVVIIGCRSVTVGIDTGNYVESFYMINSQGIGSRETKTEIINSIISWLCGRITDNPQFYLLVNSIIICSLFGLFIKNNSEDVYLSTLIFIGMFFVPAMNLMRQWLAMAFGATSFTFYQRGNNKRALIILLIAILCHTTAIVLLAIPLVERVKKKKYVIIPVSFFSLFLIFFRVRLFSFASILVPRYADYLSSSVFMNEGLFNIKNLVFIIIIAWNAYLLIFRKQTIENEIILNKLYTLEVLTILALAFSLCGTVYSMFHRVVYYFSMFLVILLPAISNRIRLRVIAKIGIIFAMFFMLYRNGIYDNNGIATYNWCWN